MTFDYSANRSGVDQPGKFFVYRVPPGVSLASESGRPLLTTPQGGKVAVDGPLSALWVYAAGRSLPEVLAGFDDFPLPPNTLRAGLACLAEAGLLVRAPKDGTQAASEPLSNGEPDRSVRGPLVSVIIVAYKSRDWLEECLPSLAAQTYRDIEIIVVDNASQDDAVAWLQAHHPEVKLLALGQQVSFAAANNRGAQVAAGDYLMLLNADVRLEPDAVEHLVCQAQAHPDCAAVGTKLKFWWAPAFLNGLGNRVGAFSWGTDNGLGHLDLGQFDDWEELPSGCFAAILISRPAWEAVGPVDEGFPMYYEDSEWSYRARLLGYPVRAAPQSVVYHAFGGRVPSGRESGLAPRKLRHVVYGRLRFTFKIVGRYFRRFLRNYWLEDWTNFTRTVARRDWDSARAYLGGWGDVVRSVSDLRRARRDLQSRRVISDEELFALQRDMPVPYAWHGLPELTLDLIQNHYLPLIQEGKTRPMPEFDSRTDQPHLVVISNDVVDEKMAGPGMRYLEIARALKDDLEVTLAVPNATALHVAGMRIIRYHEEQPAGLQVLVDNSDVALISGYMATKFPFLSNTRARLVVDYYDPIALENLHYYLDQPLDDQEELNRKAVFVTNRLAQIGDFFICGNERQRDYWMGVLTATGRMNPHNFIQDPTFRSLIDIVSVGFPDRPPRHEKGMLRGVHPQVPADAQIVLWGGGIWNWLDPLTLIKAWPQVVAAHPQARLVFLGTRHPNPLVPPHEMARKAQDLAAEIGETDRSIIFFEWVSYADREALLCEADVGVTLHPIHVETRYSLRTRVLDYFWARLPVLITDGDITSEWVRRHGLGVVVPEFDVDAVARGLIAILEKQKESWAPAFDPLHRQFTWTKAVEPLRRYCLEGQYAPDRLERNIDAVHAGGAPLGRLARARFILRTEGPRVLLHRAWRYLQWRLSRL